MKRYSTALVLAETFNFDFSEIKDYQYQAGRSDRPIYTVGDNYYCAGRIGAKPAKHWSREFKWVRYASVFANEVGWQVWEAKSE